jgi:hypothetical protein
VQVQDEDGIYVASVPELPGCHTQAERQSLVLRHLVNVQCDSKRGDWMKQEFMVTKYDYDGGYKSTGHLANKKQ